MIAVDASVDRSDSQSVLFHWCANCDPCRDVHRSGPRIAFDATQKLPGDERHGQPVRDFPPIMAMSDDVKHRVMNAVLSWLVKARRHRDGERIVMLYQRAWSQIAKPKAMAEVFFKQSNYYRVGNLYAQRLEDAA